METLELKICHYLNCGSHIHLGLLRKTNAKSVELMQKAKNEQNFGRFAELCEGECETSAARYFYQKCFEYT